MNNRNKQVEDLLAFAMVKDYVYVDSVKIADIDIQKSLRNQARCGDPVSQEQVSIYKEAISGGDVFPPVVLFAEKNKKYVILDGNHRVSSAIAAKKTAWEYGAYIVMDASEVQKKTILYTANTKHGLPISSEDRILHAIFMIEQSGMRIKDAASAFSVSPDSISVRLLANKTRERAAVLGVRIKQSLPMTTVNKIGQIKDDDVFKKIIPLTEKMSPADISTSVAAILQKTTAREQSSLISSLEDDYSKIEAKTAGVDEWKKNVNNKLSSAKCYIGLATKAIPKMIDPEVKADIIARLGEVQVAVNVLSEVLCSRS